MKRRKGAEYAAILMRFGGILVVASDKSLIEYIELSKYMMYFLYVMHVGLASVVAVSSSFPCRTRQKTLVVRPLIILFACAVKKHLLCVRCEMRKIRVLAYGLSSESLTLHVKY